MRDLVIGVIALVLGVWGLSSDWIVFREFTGAIFYSALFAWGLVSTLSGLKDPADAPAVTEIRKRDVTLDILRGFAVASMISGNAAAYALVHPHPLALRFYDSVAAPFFVMLSGMMVVRTSRSGKHTGSYYLTRGAVIMGAGAFVDMAIWQNVPFMTVDILYLIGLSLPLAYAYQKMSAPVRWTAVVVIFAAAAALRAGLGYTDFPTEISLLGARVPVADFPTSVLNHWLVDGYFPVFPWLGLSFVGVNLGLIRWARKKAVTFATRKTFLAGFGALSLGVLWGILWPPEMYVRDIYTEVFYPMTIAYGFEISGLLVVLLAFVDATTGLRIYEPFRVLGESALAIYVLHLAVIRWVVAALWPSSSFGVYVLVYAGFVAVMTLVAVGLRHLKSNWPDRPMVFKMLLAG
ncbi:MAG: DUF1624 domain-containing protein [Candidatus Omnitrophica bacterium]|nr:DUF1624 domain-containing protein [Candidatus Omnitrophota bacterium]